MPAPDMSWRSRAIRSWNMVRRLPVGRGRAAVGSRSSTSRPSGGSITSRPSGGSITSRPSGGSITSLLSGGSITSLLSGGSGMVARAGQGAGLDVGQAEILFTDPLQLGQLGRSPPPGDRQVMRGRPQVLADGDDVDADAPQVDHRLHHLAGCLAETDQDRRLREESGVLGARQHRQAATVRRRRAHGALGVGALSRCCG